MDILVTHRKMNKRSIAELIPKFLQNYDAAAKDKFGSNRALRFVASGLSRYFRRQTE